MSRRTIVAHTVLGTLLLAGTAQASPGVSARAHHGWEAPSLDLTASAHPSLANPSVRDVAFDATTSRERFLKADNTATSSATCDGCIAESTSLQVLYVPRAGLAMLDNTATAWNQACTGCSSTALSVQVVVLRGAPTATPNNRAFAVNAACDTCLSTSAAFQLVVVSDRARRLSGSSVAELRTWVDEQAALLQTPAQAPTPSLEPTPTSEPTPSARRRDLVASQDATQALGTLELLVNADLGSDTVSADVEQTVR